MLDGVLVIDKPAGLTSADVVARVKRALRGQASSDRFGHTGTLDPMATGVLPIVVGEGTKVAAYLLADDKAYDGELELGLTTTTLDIEGEVTARADAGAVTEAALRAAMAAWLGDREQIPPMYSALKQNGKRLYDLARKGIDVEREARPIRIGRFELLDFTPPRARFVVECTKGTYVRSLVRDVGEVLGCGATLTALRRTRAGRFDLSQAIPLGELTPAAAAPRIVPVGEAIAHLPAVPLDARTAIAVRHGKPLPAPADLSPPVRLVAPDGSLAALAEVAEGKFRYLRVFPER
jgi:tRNA pseudouridine55 synthase